MLLINIYLRSFFFIIYVYLCLIDFIFDKFYCEISKLIIVGIFNLDVKIRFKCGYIKGIV